MFTLLFLVLPILLVVHVLRLFTRPFRDHHYRRPFPGLDGYGGYSCCEGYGYRRRRGLGGSLFSILALVALDRLFTGRRF